MLLITGPAGIGKSALLEEALRIGAKYGMRPLTARGSELERDFGFGVAQQLLAELLQEPERTIESVPARLAARAIGIASTDVVENEGMPHGPDAPFAILNGLHRLIAEASMDRPLMVVVDDAHDADPASVRFLAYLGARVSAMPVCLVVGVRSLPTGSQAVVSRLLDESRPQVLRPRPLGRAGARGLIRDQIPAASDAVCDACRTASGGNPFFLRELADTLRRSDHAISYPGSETDAVSGVVPSGVLETVRARIHRLAPAAARLASSVAVMGDGSLLRHSASIAGMDMASAGEAADALVAAEVLASELPPRFLHPLIRAAVYSDMAPGERAAAHAHAARLLVADDAAPEHVAAHLLATDPGSFSGASDLLRFAAGMATRRGAPEAAVTYLARALEEPPSAEMRPTVLLELGEAEALTQNPGPAEKHLRRALETLVEPHRRVGAAIVLAEILGTDGRAAEAVSVLERALQDSSAAPAEVVARIEARLTNIARSDLESRQASLPRAADLRRRAQSNELKAGVALAAAAAEEAMAGESREETSRLATLALTSLDAEGTFPGDFTVFTAVRCLLAADRFDEARAALQRAREQARHVGAIVTAATAEAFWGDFYLRTGDVPAAIAACEDSLRRAHDGWGLGIPAASAMLAEGLIERGEHEAAGHALAGGGLSLTDVAVGSSYVFTMLLHARGRVRLAGGHHADALRDLLEVGRRQRLMAEFNPALIPWRSNAAGAFAALGRVDEGRDLAHKEVALARRFGAPRALGLALVAAGEVQEGSRRESLLREAEQLLRVSPARLAHARALSALGEYLSSAGSLVAARGFLTDALDAAAACGASALQERVMRQLRATGARPRRPAARGVTALTPSERRVAEMAARGMTNREIAEQMFVTVRTVEFHLGGVFRKLGIASRRELSADVLAFD